MFDEHQRKTVRKEGSQKEKEREEDNGQNSKKSMSVCQAAWASAYDGWSVPHPSSSRLLTAHNGSEINREAEHFHQLPL